MGSKDSFVTEWEFESPFVENSDRVDSTRVRSIGADDGMYTPFRGEPEVFEEEFFEEDERPFLDEFLAEDPEFEDEEALAELEGGVEHLCCGEAEYSQGEEESFEDAASVHEDAPIRDRLWVEPKEEGPYSSEEELDEGEVAQLDAESSFELEDESDWATHESEQWPAVSGGRGQLDKVPLLRRHHSAGPDLILSWNDIGLQPQSVDVVVHLHGYSLSSGRLLNISRDIVPRSGLDWSDPEGVDRSPGRRRPTLALLPKGHFFGGKSGRGYNFPALVTETGLRQLIGLGLDHLARHIGATKLAPGRLIISAHSGGGAALLKLLRHNDPDEIYIFDGLYQDPGELVRWARSHVDRDQKTLAGGVESADQYMRERGGALRVQFRPGTATQQHSISLHRALTAAIPPESALQRWYRVEQTRLGHLLIPRQYGWQLLANSAAELPGASMALVATKSELYDSGELELEEGEADFRPSDETNFAEAETPSARRVVFPSGESLQVVTGLPEGKQQDYWDPTGSGNPLLDTGSAHKNKMLSKSFSVRELTTSGGVSANVARIDPKLVEALQRLRDHVGKSINITSGYRSWKRNKEVYAGRKNKDGTPQKPTQSQHCGGRAVDVAIPGMNGLDIGRAAIDACGPNLGVGLGNNFAHIDVRGTAVAWNYGGVKDSWVTEIKRYQKEKAGSSRPPTPGATAKSAAPTPGAPKVPAELVRFAQRVLNSTEGERLDDDGDLGRITRSALERFRARYGLGSGGVLDSATGIALVQRTLEELAQQSMFPRFGVLDPATEQALAAFKTERALGFDAKVDAATRAALIDALAPRTASTRSPQPAPAPAVSPGTVTDFRRRIVDAAKAEWEKWGRGTKDETDPGVQSLLAEYWMNYRPNGSSLDEANENIRKRAAWSAVFISYVMRQAGAGKTFSYSSVHTNYIAAAKRAALANDLQKFRAFEIFAAKPEVGDLVCRDRSPQPGKACAGTNFANVDKGGISHSDIVVETGRGYCVILGGNTAQSYPTAGKKEDTVGQRRIKLDDRGYVIPDQRSDKCIYFAVVKPPELAASVPATVVKPIKATSIVPSEAQSGLPGLGTHAKPPSDPNAYRKFRLTTYYIVDQRGAPTSSISVPIYDDQRRKIAAGSPAFFAQLSLEGTARLIDGRLINVTGKTVPVSHDDYKEVLAHHIQAYAKRDSKRRAEGKEPISTRYSGVVVENGRVARALAFHEVPASQRGVGYGIQRGIPYIPFRTLAADIGHVKYANVEPKWKGKGGLVPAGTQVYIKEYDGIRLPDGTRHDGWFIVNDTGGGIFGVHFDVFVGTRVERDKVKLPEFGQAWFAGIEQRIPTGYKYGLTI